MLRSRSKSPFLAVRQFLAALLLAFSLGVMAQYDAADASSSPELTQIVSPDAEEADPDGFTWGG